MKIGRTLPDLAAELERQREHKHDYVGSTKNMQLVMNHDDGSDVATHKLLLGDDKTFDLTKLFHDQVAEHVKIPTSYYKRMLVEAPELLCGNVNTWFSKNPTDRMVRTLDSNGRAFLSSAYRPLDNSDLAEAVLPPLIELGVEVMSCEITGTRMYIKAIDQRVNKDIPTGRRMGDGTHTIFDTVCPAIIISNSEVGLGALSVQTGIYTKMCTNMATFAERSTRKYHVGQRADFGEELYALLSDKTRRLNDAGLWATVRDVVKNAFDQAQFEALADRVGGAASDDMGRSDPSKIVEVTAKKMMFTEEVCGSVLQHLVRGGDLSRYGLHAAITRAAEDQDNYDNASWLERQGGKIIEMQRNEWEELLAAA